MLGRALASLTRTRTLTLTLTRLATCYLLLAIPTTTTHHQLLTTLPYSPLLSLALPYSPLLSLALPGSPLLSLTLPLLSPCSPSLSLALPYLFSLALPPRREAPRSTASSWAMRPTRTGMTWSRRRARAASGA